MKNLLTLLLSLLALACFGQPVPINIRTGDPRTLLSAGDGMIFDPTTGIYMTDTSKVVINITIAQLRASTTLNVHRRYYITDAGRECIVYRLGSAADDNGINFKDGNNLTWHRSYDGKNVVITWWAIIGDGVTDNTTNFTNASPYWVGQNILGSKGQFVVNNATWTNPQNEEFIGAGRDSTNFICTTTDQCFGFAGAVRHFKMHAFSVNCTWTNLTQDFSHALIASYGLVNDDVEIYDFKGSCANSNSGVITFYVQTGGQGGSIRHLKIHDFDCVNVGQTAVSIVSRDSTGQAGLIAGTTPIANTGYDSCYDVRIEKFTCTNTGSCSGAVNGMAVTIDGYGYDIYVGFGVAKNGLNQGFENTSMWYVTFDNLSGEGPGTGRAWELFAIGNTISGSPVYHMTLNHCVEVDTMNTGDGATNANDLQIINCTFKAKNGFKFKNCSNILSTGTSYISNDVAGLAVVSTPGNVSVGNIFNQCYIDNTTFGSNQGAVIFDGKGVNNTKLINCKVRKGTGGVYVLWKDTAGNQNYVTGFDFGSGVSNSFRSIALPATATRDTLSNDDDLPYTFYQITATVSQIDTVFVQSRAHTNYLVNNTASQPVFWAQLNSGSGVLIPVGATLNLFSDSLNLKSVQAASLSGASVLPTGTTATTQTVGDLTKAVATDSFAAITAIATLNGAHLAASFNIPTVSSKTGIASFTTDTAWYSRNGTTVTVCGHVTAAATTANTTVGLFLTPPIASVLIGGHTMWGVANTTAFTVASTGSGTGAAASEGVVTGDPSGKVLITWIASTTGSVDWEYIYQYHLQ